MTHPESQPHQYVFAGGGTGGHLFPGLALAAQLQADNPGPAPVFIGTQRVTECRILESAPVVHHRLPMQPPRDALRRPLRSWRIAGHIRRRIRSLLRTLDPAVVVGLGGYASVPTVVIAHRLGIPIVLLEQNAVPGRATRWLARRANRICLSFAESAWGSARLRQRMRVTGNPVRAEIARMQPPSDADTSRQLLVLGGSQGARAINHVIPELLKSLSGSLRGWTVIHQTGTDEACDERLGAELPDLVYSPRAFIADMPAVLAQTSLVIARSGATTLAELACAGVPAVLIPHPSTPHDHQRRNAEHYVRAGGARLVNQIGNAIDVRQLHAAVEPWIASATARATAGRAQRNGARPDATEAVIRQIRELLAEA